MSFTTLSMFELRISDHSERSTPPATSPAHLEESKHKNEPKLPTVIVEGDTISSTFAARLVMCTIGHVLYLKDQIPYPVAQLARLATRPEFSPTKDSRKRVELLEAIDLLSCHLRTTFDELSRSLARNNMRYPRLPTSSRRDLRPNAEVHLILALGSTIASARSRVIVNIDGFEVKTYERDDQDLTDDDDDDEAPVALDESDNIYYEDDIPPLVTEDLVDPGVISSSEESDNEETNSISSYNNTVASEEELYLNAERTLSRTITSNDMLSTTMAPTTTFVLLRAPRNFNHPEWLPQPRFQKVLNSHLAQCQEGVCVRCGVSRVTIPESTADSYHETATDDEDHELMWWVWTGKLVGFAHQ